jgi:hypothetical protein
MNDLATIRPLTLSKMGLKKEVEPPIPEDTLELRKLFIYQQMWDNLHEFRMERKRSARYLEGKQWEDFVTDRNGNQIKEDQYILDQGQLPLKQNRIKSTVRTLVGQFRADNHKSVVVSRTPDSAKESEMLSNGLQCALHSVNHVKEIDSRLYEEFLLSGLPVQRISYEYINDLKRRDLIIRNCHPNTMFFNGNLMDVRGFDIDCIGRFLDLSFDKMIVNFGTSPERKRQLREIYGSVNNRYSNLVALSSDNIYNNNFFVPQDLTKCRVIEVWEERLVEVMEVHDMMDGTRDITDWTQKHLDAYNKYRINKFAEIGIPEEEVPLCIGELMTVQKWFYTYYTPWGHVLREGESPFWHGSHPFVITPYPLIDGKVQGLVPDLLDAQRQMNRLLILQNMILSSSAKNTIILDKNSLDGKSPEEVDAEYRKIGGVLVLDLDKGRTHPPIEVKGSIGNFGINEMIQMYVTMLQDVSGVQPAMQGHAALSGTSGALYAQQVENSTMNSKDMQDAFMNFLLMRDMKALKTIQQYYDKPVMLAVSGSAFADTAHKYDPAMVSKVEFDMVIGQSNDSPIYRAAIEDTLNQFVMKGIIDLRMFLENTTMPFKQNLLESLRKREEQAMMNPQAAVAGLTEDVKNAGVQGNQQLVDNTYNQMKAA